MTTKLELDLLAIRIQPHVSFGDDGKPHVKLGKLSPADRKAVSAHIEHLRRRLAPWLYFQGRLITEAEIDDCLRNSGLKDDYRSGQLSKRKALEMTKASLRQASELYDNEWRGRRRE